MCSYGPFWSLVLLSDFTMEERRKEVNGSIFKSINNEESNEWDVEVWKFRPAFFNLLFVNSGLDLLALSIERDCHEKKHESEHQIELLYLGTGIRLDHCFELCFSAGLL